MLEIPGEKLKELLIADGIVTGAQFDAAGLQAERMNQGVADILIGENNITEDYYYNLLSSFYGVPRAGLSERTIDEQALRLLGESIAREKRAIVFAREADGTLEVAMENPVDLTAVEFLETRLKAKVKPFLATRDDLNKGLAYYGEKGAEDFKRIIEDDVRASLALKAKDAKVAAEEIPIVQLTDNLFSYGIALRASDIHIEILAEEILVRFRVDGVLHEILRLPKEIHPAIVARVKLLSALKLDEHFKPQDGRFRYKIAADFMDIRVSTIPTFYGEKVEMRLLSATEHPLSFEELGMLPETVALLKANIAKTYGVVLVTGPTGSGKTTTLYSIMNVLNRPEVNIVTIEDPIEYDMKYVNQTQVNAAAGITFADGLRSILRQDPNIIMVGEIRDEETAEISVHAALTGHLVLSSLHTNDAPTAVPRFIDMGVAPFLVAAVLNAIMAQRLVRRICVSCIYSYPPGAEEFEGVKLQADELKVPLPLPKRVFKGKGCPVCNNTGYRGRLGIYEVVNVTESLREFIVSREFTLDGFRSVARKAGYATMFEDGLKKVERGFTTIEEVLRVIRE